MPTIEAAMTPTRRRGDDGPRRRSAEDAAFSRRMGREGAVMAKALDVKGLECRRRAVGIRWVAAGEPPQSRWGSRRVADDFESKVISFRSPTRT
jgi:hypothetical protein